MQIFGPYRVNTNMTPQTGGPNQPKPTETQGNRVSSSQPIDQLDLSSEVQGANRIGAAESPTVDGIRFEKVAEIRRQIADGSYDTDEKLDSALDRLLDEIG